MNQQRQFGAQQGMTAQQLNQGAGLQGAQLRLGASGQMGRLGEQAFQTGRTISQDQMQQGLMQQGLQQALIDAARGQYAGYTGAPTTGLQTQLGAMGSTPVPETETTSTTPGVADYLSMIFGVGAKLSDIRLKTNIKPLGKENGVNVYSWDWNEDGKRIADPKPRWCRRRRQVCVAPGGDPVCRSAPHTATHRGSSCERR